jgi:hypothetical protein
MSQKPEQKENSTQPAQPQQPQQTQADPSQRQYQPQYQQRQYPRKQYYKKNYRRNYDQRYDNYQGDKNHARIVVTRDVYHKLVQYVLKYYGTLKGMSSITSELLDKAIDEAIADKENRKKYSQEMHLHSEV